MFAPIVVKMSLSTHEDNRVYKFYYLGVGPGSAETKTYKPYGTSSIK